MDVKKLPSLPKGMRRQWTECRKCGNVAYYDFTPGSLSNPIMSLPCHHDMGERWTEVVKNITEEEAVKKMSYKPWKMPKWMKPFVPLISDTGGNDIEELMNDDGKNSNVFNNAPRALICVAVQSQVNLLERLHKLGHLGGVFETPKKKVS